MSVLDATLKGAVANSYQTVDRADELLAQRLYVEKWDAGATTPDAVGYLANGVVAIGQTDVVVDTGTGTFTVGSKVRFDGHPKLYTVSSALTGDGTLSFTPALTTAVADGEVVSLLTANEKEKALIWGTVLFDEMMLWNGLKTTDTQRLRWPRSSVLDPDGDLYDQDVLPEILEIAHAEFALVLLERNKFKLPAILGQGISEAALGPLKVKVDDSQQVATIPDNILSLLSPLGHLEQEARKNSIVVPLRRV